MYRVSLDKTKWGRYVVAIGSNERSAVYSAPKIVTRSSKWDASPTVVKPSIRALVPLGIRSSWPAWTALLAFVQQT